MHYCNFRFLFSKRVKFLGRENILRPLVILRQHALAYNRIIALGTTVQKTHSVFYNSTLTHLGSAELKGNLVDRRYVNMGPNKSKQHFQF